MFIIYGDVTQTRSFPVAQIIMRDCKDQKDVKNSIETKVKMAEGS